MSLLNFCDEIPAVVKLETTAADAIQLMLEKRVGGVAVLDDQKRVAGIFTERDVLRKLALSGRDPHRTPVRELMATPVHMATEHTTAGEALEVMVERHIRHLPICDDGGHLLGMLSIRNLLQAQVDDLKRELDSLETSMTNDAAGG